ncbi:MAG: TadE/TadG family type IV pilus assembly protein [Alphaproteobacteria bacterium]|nr:TadE/TadG family type IV pilus assembly protein [Alphaproteobacteria bacterium]
MAGHFYSLFGSFRSLRRRKQKGATAVEMALIAPAFFLLMIGTIEGALMLTAQQLMEHATFNTSRLAKTGFVASGQTQAQTVNQVLMQELQSFGTMIDTTQVTMTSTAYTTFNMIGAPGQGSSTMGTPEQIVVYTVSYPWRLFTPMLGAIMGTNGIVTLTSRIVVRNEPYS